MSLIPNEEWSEWLKFRLLNICRLRPRTFELYICLLIVSVIVNIQNIFICCNRIFKFGNIISFFLFWLWSKRKCFRSSFFLHAFQNVYLFVNFIVLILFDFYLRTLLLLTIFIIKFILFYNWLSRWITRLSFIKKLLIFQRLYFIF